MPSYLSFARFYDGLMQDACYEKRCDYILKLAESFGHDMGITLDLACGTGTLTRLLKKRGVDVFGIDYSMEMLSEAMQSASEEGLDILFLRQKMKSIDLYGTINTCVCTLDSINHLTKIEDVAKTFDRVGLFMDDDGLFIFDVNTVYKHKNVLADNTFVYENDSVFCVWQNTPEDDNKVTIDLDFFEEENGVYYRSSESFSERAYTDDEIRKMLTDAGFKVEAKKIHHLSRSATAALGRLLCATSIMGDMLKQKDASVNLRVMGDGELGPVIAVGDSNGNVKGYVGNADCPTEYYENGKINVAKAVGRTGMLNVMRDYGSGDPYIGQVELVSGEIAEDIANYYATSEQIPTVCALGVLIDKEDGEVLLAGGLLIQLLPGADDTVIDKLEKNIAELEPVTTMLAKGMSILDICKTALKGFEVEVLDENPVKYVCGCSKEKLENYFCTLSDDDIRSMVNEQGVAVATCHFCNKKYVFTKDDLEKLIAEKNSKE